MKKALYSLGISFIAIGISSLALNENNEKVTTPANRLTSETTSDAAAISTCEGCHSGSATNGPIIIVYTDQKKENIEFPIMEGTNEIIVYNESRNDSFINQLTSYLSQIKLNTNPISKPSLFANQNFYTIHGGMSAHILQNCQTLSVESSSNTTVKINTNNILHCEIEQVTRNDITVNIDMKEERLTTLKVFDLNGKLIHEETTMLAKGENEINLLSSQQLASGLYFMQIKGDEQLITNKFFIP